MIDVLLTVDVEVWCDSWERQDETFADCFRGYVYGPTAKGQRGLPYQTEVLNDHGLKAVFFVESLFASRFGVEPLAEIVGLLQQGRQEVQLHLHPEWAQEARTPILAPFEGRRSAMAQFDLDAQTRLLTVAKAHLAQAGQPEVKAFRAGSFAFNTDTIRALRAAGIPFDASYNASLSGPYSGLRPGETPTQPFDADGVWEYPMTVFRDGAGKLRHVQLTACSSQEIESVLWQAAEEGTGTVVILWHNFELLSDDKRTVDPIVQARFRRLCRFLRDNDRSFRVRGFEDMERPTPSPERAIPSTGVVSTGMRMAEQLLRRVAYA